MLNSNHNAVVRAETHVCLHRQLESIITRYEISFCGVIQLSWFYYVGRWLVRVALLFTRFELTGRENIPKEGPLIVVANHLSLADPPILGVAVSRKMLFMAKEELFRSRLSGYFVRGYGAFPVYRGRLGLKALKEAERLLGRGLALAIFPEGRRSPTGKLANALPGVGLLAYRSRAPVLPVGFTGTEKIKGLGWLIRRPRVTVRIGPAFTPIVPDGKPRPVRALKELTDDIMKHIAQLLPVAYGGNYLNKRH